MCLRLRLIVSALVCDCAHNLVGLFTYLLYTSLVRSRRLLECLRGHGSQLVDVAASTTAVQTNAHGWQIACRRRRRRRDESRTTLIITHNNTWRPRRPALSLRRRIDYAVGCVCVCAVRRVQTPKHFVTACRTPNTLRHNRWLGVMSMSSLIFMIIN